jgi:chromate transporter
MPPVREVALLFLKLGCTAFGGPAVHIAMMRRETVEKRRWLGEQEFLDLLGATNLIPGPNSTEMAIHLGYLRAGGAGLFAAGACFIVPPMLMVLAAAWAYVRFGALPQLGWLLYGVKPVVVALVLQALWNLGRKGMARPLEAFLGIASLAAYFAGWSEIGILAAGGAIAWAAGAGRDRSGRDGGKAPADGARERAGGGKAAPADLPPPPSGDGKAVPADLPPPPSGDGPSHRALPAAAIAGAGALPALPALPAWALFLKFLKIGSVLYGSGYVLLPFLDAAFAGPGGPLTRARILDAVAVGQVTPGPFFTTATFIGYLLGGVTGGLLATLGIFLPAFVLVAATNPWIPRLRASRALGRILDGVNAASLGLMAGAAWQSGRAAVIDKTTAALGAGALLLLLRKVSSTGLIAAGGAIGIGARWLFP